MKLFLKIFSVFFFFFFFNKLSSQNIKQEGLGLDSDSNVLYNVTFKKGKNPVTGILVSQKIFNGVRVSILSKFGMKLFDISFYEDSLKVHYIIPSINKKMILKVLHNDFKLLFPVLVSNKKSKVKKNTLIVKSKNRTYLYQFEANKLNFVKRKSQPPKAKFHKMGVQIDHLLYKLTFSLDFLNHEERVN